MLFHALLLLAAGPLAALAASSSQSTPIDGVNTTSSAEAEATPTGDQTLNTTAANGYGHYTHSCNFAELFHENNKWLMQADCETKNHKRRCTRLDPELCYKYDINGDGGVGEIVASRDGRGLVHCADCKIGGINNEEFSCTCGMNDGHAATHYVITDDLISNNDGYLQCFDSKSRGTETCP
ncbi:Uu.00g033010.m01.CDS01 [Anthostomella pinea]|uniref:Uu.00g033010.m01.CDS01 n=1 Tax=Anthostomella pinea TaxID=933095 RepID=A0AAI8YDC9_9PEZI|nr:Uu.00g033010.m01.CDS01 [Anthostomella pinea]